MTCLALLNPSKEMYGSSVALRENSKHQTFRLWILHFLRNFHPATTEQRSEFMTTWMKTFSTWPITAQIESEGNWCIQWTFKPFVQQAMKGWSLIIKLIRFWWLLRLYIHISVLILFFLTEAISSSISFFKWNDSFNGLFWKSLLHSFSSSFADLEAMRIVVLAILLLCLHVNGSKYYHRIHKVECGSSNKTVIKYYCFIKAYNRRIPMFNSGFNLTRKLKGGKVRVNHWIAIFV